jgi:hypothetical protein
MRKSLYLYFSFLSFLWSCQSPEPSQTVDFADTLKTVNEQEDISKQKLFVAIASITSPKETHAYYGELLNHISH